MFGPEDYLDFAVADTRSGGVRPSFLASLAAPLRLEVPSLPRIADTWCSTVRTELGRTLDKSHVSIVRRADARHH
jgi:hypothetical protein